MSVTKYEWEANPNGISAHVDGALLLICRRVHGPNCDEYPWGWEVCWDDVDRDVVSGRTSSLAKAVAAVENAYRAAQRLPAIAGRGNLLWTPEEDAMLRELRAAKVPLRDVAASLSRSVLAVKNRIHVLGVQNTRIKAWTWAEIRHAKALKARGKTYAQIGAELGRTRNGVRDRLQATA